MDPYRTRTEISQNSEVRSLSHDRQDKQKDDAQRDALARQEKADRNKKRLDDVAASLRCSLQATTSSGWSICSRSKSLVLTSPLRFTTSCLPVATRSATPISVVDCFLPDILFQKLQSIFDGALAIGLRKRGGRYLAHHFYPKLCDIRKHFFHRLLFSLVKRKSIAAHFEPNHESVNFKLMPKARFEYLNSNLVYSYEHFSESEDARKEIDSFNDLCRLLMWSYWRPSSNLAFDELVLPYQGASKLVTHIPRKPHDTGLLLYLLGMETQNGDAVILDFFPIDREPKVPGLDCFISMMDKVADADAFRVVRPHFFVDALFGGTESVSRGSAKNCFVTASVSDNTERSLINVLSYDLQSRKYRVAHKKLFGQWYTTFLTYNDNAVVNVASNAAYCSEDFRFVPPQSESLSSSSSSSSTSSSVAGSSLPTSSHAAPIPAGTSTNVHDDASYQTSLSDTFRSVVLTLEEAVGLSSFGDQFPRALRLISQRCGIRSEEAGGAPLNVVSKLTGFSVTELSRKRPRSENEADGDEANAYNNLSNKALVALLKERKLNSVGKKEELIRRLLWSDRSKEVRPSEELLEFVGPSHQGPPTSVPLYTQYLDHFNYIDKFNRNFYSIRFPHRETDSVHQFVWSTLNILFINAWVAYRETSPIRSGMSLEQFSYACIESVLNNGEYYGRSETE